MEPLNKRSPAAARGMLMTERCKDIAASGFTVYTCLAQVSHARKNPDQDERNMFVLSAECINPTSMLVRPHEVGY